jgi:hypothetical protein
VEPKTAGIRSAEARAKVVGIQWAEAVEIQWAEAVEIQ